MKPKKTSGYLSITVLVFVSIFVVVFAGLANLSTSQSRVQRSKEQGLSALEIAEAGFDYYKWHLAHYPNDIKDGTENTGPYLHDYVDPETSSIGKFSLEITGNEQCGEIARVDIASTGWTNDNPNLKKTIYGSYARPSAAAYSYILDSSVFAGDDRVIYGPFHSNGGIRFDGTNYSSVSSGQSAWNCTSDYGCNPRNAVAPGVTGSGGSQSLWRWPVPQVDFSILAKNTTNVFQKNIASTTPSVCTAGQTKGCLFPRVSGTTGRGYHVIMKANGTFDLYRVNTAESVRGCQATGSCGVCGGNWKTEESVIANSSSGGSCPLTPKSSARTFLGTYTPPTSCRVLYFDDNVWLEGTVKNKVTIIAASTTSTVDPNIYIRNNVLYSSNDGTDGLTAIAEDSIVIPIDSPENLDIHGIFVAQKGNFGRNYYTKDADCPGQGEGSGKKNNVAGKYNSCINQDTMKIFGSVVSKGRVGTKWGDVSGYNYREDSYDTSLVLNPPPFTPYTSEEYQFIQWNQK